MEVSDESCCETSTPALVYTFPYLNSSRLKGTLTALSTQALRVALPDECSGVHHVT